MTTDKTMTDVDTSADLESVLDLIGSIHLVDGEGEEAEVEFAKWKKQAAEFVQNLASRCDELERLAGDAHELIDQILGELDEAPIGPHKVELALLCEHLKAYQRKGE